MSIDAARIRRFFYDLARPVQILQPRDAYALWAPSYDDNVNNAVLALEDEFILPIFDELQVADKRIVDLGCGTGRHIIHCLALHATNIVGIDISDAMLERARTKIRSKGVSLIQSSLEQLPISDAQFDIGIASLVLSHAPNIRTTLIEIARILRPGASLVLTDVHWSFNERKWHRTFRPMTSPSKRIAPRSYFHTLTDYQQAFEQNHLVIERFLEPTIGLSVRPIFERSGMVDVFNQYEGQPLLAVFQLRKQ
jgi:malonyl-CoA O-methyltransferase